MGAPDKNEPPAMSQPLEVAGCWTPPRLELHGWLTRNAPSLAELYRGAVTLLYDSPLPGRVRFIALAVREIRNRLPDVISGAKGGGRFNWKDRLDHLVRLWTQQKLPLDETLPGVTFSDPGPDLHGPKQVSLPVPIMRAIARLLKDHAETREKPLEAATRLFETCAPENQQLQESLRPVVKHWIEVTEWFVPNAHDTGKMDADVDETLLRRQFELFERTLVALVGGFFVTVRELDEILEEANS
ncbi:MAG: hypothetical protein ACHQ9S_02230 [Candidatus Binatia bacterium]